MICVKCGADKPPTDFRVNARKSAPRRDCRGCERAVSLAHARAHAEERRVYSRAYYAGHRAERDAYRRRRRAENGPYVPSEAQKQRHLEMDRIRRRAKSPAERHERYEHWANYFRARSARVRGATIVEDVDLARIVARDGDACYLCGKLLVGRDRTFDHVVPLARGGTHTEDNIRLACRSCNGRKRNKLLAELAS